MANMGKAMMIMMINKFFTTLGYILIMTGGAATFYFMFSTLTYTPILQLPVNAIALPYVPIVISALLSYFMAMLFMEIYELAVLTFMFVRDKNMKECRSEFGPEKSGIDQAMEEIDNQGDEYEESILTPEQREARRKIAESNNGKNMDKK